jgi:hypothetical protein
MLLRCARRVATAQKKKTITGRRMMSTDCSHDHHACQAVESVVHYGFWLAALWIFFGQPSCKCECKEKSKKE